MIYKFEDHLEKFDWKIQFNVDNPILLQKKQKFIELLEQEYLLTKYKK